MNSMMNRATLARRQNDILIRFAEVVQCWDVGRYTDSILVEVSSRSDLTALTALFKDRDLAAAVVSDSLETARPAAIVSAGPAQAALSALEDANWHVTWRRDLWMMPGRLVAPGVLVLDCDA